MTQAVQDQYRCGAAGSVVQRVLVALLASVLLMSGLVVGAVPAAAQQSGPALVAEPGSVDFGVVDPDVAHRRTVLLEMQQDVYVDNITITSGVNLFQVFGGDCAFRNWRAGQICTFTVDFRPSQVVGLRTGAVSVGHRLPGQSLQFLHVPVQGTPAYVPTQVPRVTLTEDAGAIAVRWNAPENRGSEITIYRIYRSDATSARALLATVPKPPAAGTFRDASIVGGRAYTYQVSAVNGRGEGALSEPVSLAAATVPAQVASLSVTATEREQLDVAWEPPSSDGGRPVTGYVVTAAAAGQTTRTLMLAGTERSARFVGLPARTLFDLTVTPRNDLGAGTGRTAMATTLGPPSGVRQLEVTTDPEPRTIFVRFDAPADDGGAAVSYDVRFETFDPATGRTSRVTSITTGTSFRVDGLPDGSTTTVTVTPYNRAGNGPSSTGSARTISVPDPVMDVSVTRKQPGEFAVAWTPGFNGGSPAGHLIQALDAAGGVHATVFQQSGGPSTVTVGGLANATEYSIVVTPRNVVGRGEPKSIQARTLAAPGVPRDVTVTRPARGHLRVSWQPPADDGGSRPGYRVEAAVVDDGSVSDGAPTSVDVPSGGDTSVLLSGLRDGTSYTVTVTPSNVVGDGERATISARTLGAPGAVTGLVVRPGPGRGQVQATWNAPTDDGGAPELTYDVQVLNTGGAEAPVEQPRTVVDGRSATVSGLPDGALFELTVAARNTIGAGEAVGAPVRTFDRPAAPTGLTVTAGPGRGRVTARWVAPTRDGGTSVTGYDVKVTTVDEMGRQSTRTIRTTEAGVLLADLGDATDVAVSVTAVNLVGAGPAGDSVSASTFGPAGPVRELAGRAGGGRGQITTGWLAPADDGGTPIVGYIVTATADGSASPTVTVQLPASARSATLSGLADGTRYLLSVRALNEVGDGASPAGPVLLVRTFAAAGAPQQVTAVRELAGNRVRWAPPASDGGTPVTAYQLWRRVGTEPATLLVTLPGSAREHLDGQSGLQLRSVHYSLIAVNLVGPGARSAEATVAGLPLPG